MSHQSPGTRVGHPRCQQPRNVPTGAERSKSCTSQPTQAPRSWVIAGRKIEKSSPPVIEPSAKNRERGAGGHGDLRRTMTTGVHDALLRWGGDSETGDRTAGCCSYAFVMTIITVSRENQKVLPSLTSAKPMPHPRRSAGPANGDRPIDGTNPLCSNGPSNTVASSAPKDPPGRDRWVWA